MSGISSFNILCECKSFNTRILATVHSECLEFSSLGEKKNYGD